MERKYLKAIGITAIVLTVAILAYTMTAATIGDRASTGGVSRSSQSSNTSSNTQSQQARVDEKLFPGQLAGMSLINALSGQEAIQSVSQLHGTNIQLQTAYVVAYQGDNNTQMTIWYSEAKNDQDASDLFTAMDSKVPKSNAFQNYKTVKVAGRDYKFVTGMGQEHYYWKSGKRVIWVAIGGSNTANILQQVAPLYN